MNDYNLDEVIQEALNDPVVKAAAIENDFRRWLAAEIESVCDRKDISVRKLAAKMETSKSQIQRLLHKEVGGSLTLRSVIRALVALELGLDARIYDARTKTVDWNDHLCFSWPSYSPETSGTALSAFEERSTIQHTPAAELTIKYTSWPVSTCGDFRKIATNFLDWPQPETDLVSNGQEDWNKNATSVEI